MPLHSSLQDDHHLPPPCVDLVAAPTADARLAPCAGCLATDCARARLADIVANLEHGVLEADASAFGREQQMIVSLGSNTSLVVFGHVHLYGPPLLIRLRVVYNLFATLSRPREDLTVMSTQMNHR